MAAVSPRPVWRRRGRDVPQLPRELPAGIYPEFGDRPVFLYLVNRPSPWGFRLFLLRHVALLEALSHWTIRLLFPKPLVKARHAYLNAAREHLATPLQVRRDVVDQMFRERSRDVGAGPPHVPLTPLSAALDSPRLRALYQQWLVDPEFAIEQAQSRGLAIALERGTGHIECVDLTRQYLHLSPLVDIS